MKIEIEHEGSCFGCNGRSRTADRPRRPGERPFRRCPGSLEGPRPGSPREQTWSRAMPVRVPSFAPWGSPLQRAGRRRDNPKGREPVRRNRRTKPVSVMAFKSLHDFNLETFGTEVLLTLASVTTG